MLGAGLITSAFEGPARGDAGRARALEAIGRTRPQLHEILTSKAHDARTPQGGGGSPQLIAGPLRLGHLGRLVAQYQELVSRYGEQGVGAPGVVGELDLEHACSSAHPSSPNTMAEAGTGRRADGVPVSAKIWSQLTAAAEELQVPLPLVDAPAG